MRRDRLSVAAPMAIIVVVSVELAALNWGTGVAVDVVRVLTVVLLALATYFARYRTGDEGAWWFGFSLFGWAYYALVLDVMGRWLAFSSESIVSILPTAIMDFWTRGSQASVVQRFQGYPERLRILYEMCIVLVAILGGTVCWVIERRRRPSTDERS
jgi:hypothetical protein